MRYTAVMVAAVFIRCCLSLNPDAFVECKANTMCSQNRGKIIFDSQLLNSFHGEHFKTTSWIIKPDENTRSSITIAFKNFNVLGDIFIAFVYSADNIVWKTLSWDFGSNFEFSSRGAESFLLYVPSDERGSFDAFFYLGCEVLSASSGEMSFPKASDFNFQNGKCWIVEPLGIHDLSRLYFTFRDVYLKQGSRLSVTDIHTDALVASITGSVQYDIYESNLRGRETFMIELTCGGRNERCSNFGNIFNMSYYSLSRREVACVEVKRQCALGSSKLPTAMCQQSCPKLDQILQEELQKEGPVYNPQTPIVKSGIPRRARLMAHLSKKVNETQEQRRLQQEKEEKEKKEKETSENEKREHEEAENDESDGREVEPAPKQWNCRLPAKYCKCIKNISHVTRYCFSKKKCKIFKECTMGCIIARVFVCAKVTSSARIELFGG